MITVFDIPILVYVDVLGELIEAYATHKDEKYWYVDLGGEQVKVLNNYIHEKKAG